MPLFKRGAIVVSNLVATLLTAPLFFFAKASYAVGTDCVFISCAQFLSLFPGKIGMFLRRAYYRQTLDHCGAGLNMEFGSYISKRGTRIGDKVGTGAYVLIGLADIGNDAFIGSRTSIMSGRQQHNFIDPDTPVFSMQNFTRIRLGEHAFIGEGSVVMASIGEKSIIGAGSVVVKEIPPLKVAVGNPARVFKDRKNEGLN